jgi:hypothetical protein
VAYNSQIDTGSHTITTRIDHFSTYAIVAPKPHVVSWALFISLVLGEFLLGALAVAWLILRKRNEAVRQTAGSPLRNYITTQLQPFSHLPKKTSALTIRRRHQDDSDLKNKIIENIGKESQ